MTTHTNCTHPATKSARAICRRNSTQASPTDRAAKAAHKVLNQDAESPAKRLRAKAEASTAGKAHKRSDSDEGQPLAPKRGPLDHLYRSGHCDVGRHGRCAGQYTLTPCSCACHKPGGEGVQLHDA